MNYKVLKGLELFTFSVPIEAAKNIAENFSKTHVVVLTYDSTGTTDVVTYGKDLAASDYAAQAGNHIKEHFLRWPTKEERMAVPDRVKRMKLEAQIELLNSVFVNDNINSTEDFLYALRDKKIIEVATLQADKKRPLHTMTAKEFNQWINGAMGELEDDEAERYVRTIISKSLHELFFFLGSYGNFDSITWLIEHNFDIAFTEARKHGSNLL